jgi:hypothetical protein
MKAFPKITTSEKIGNKFLTTVRYKYTDPKLNYTGYIVSNVEIDCFNVNSQLFEKFKNKNKAIQFCKN